MQEPFEIDFDQPIDQLQSRYKVETRRLGEIEDRLGTREEQAGDIEDAQRLAHILSNLKLVINLSAPAQSLQKAAKQNKG
ncbi:MAG: hypothetical protein AAGB46_02680 [Verrucomicrobiota bacterium]